MWRKLRQFFCKTKFSQEEKERGVSMCNVIEKVENKAIEKGKELGKLEKCFEFVLDGTVSVAVAAKKMCMSEETFAEKYENWKVENMAK